MPQRKRHDRVHNPDSDLQRQRSKFNRDKAFHDRQAQSAKDNGLSSFKGMDGVDFSGPRRREYNLSSAKSYMNTLKINKVDAEKTRRDKGRDATAKNIRDRMNRKRGGY